MSHSQRDAAGQQMNMKREGGVSEKEKKWAVLHSELIFQHVSVGV